MYFFERRSYKVYLHDIIDCLVTALEASDFYTAGHSTRVGDMSYEIAKAMGISGKLLSDIHIAAHLHDIGKIGIPKDILNKEGKLYPHEWAYIQTHPVIGYNILSRSAGLRSISEIVLHHHERYNGTGYPNKLSEEAIPLGSRIIALADAIDAMTSKRSYRQAMTWEACRCEIDVNCGIQFDPKVVEAASGLWKKWAKE